MTADENFERFPGEYYTQEDVRKLIDLPIDTMSHVIPEIDMPGLTVRLSKGLSAMICNQERYGDSESTIDRGWGFVCRPLFPYWN